MSQQDYHTFAESTFLFFHSVEVFYVKTYSKMGNNELLVKYTTAVSQVLPSQSK